MLQPNEESIGGDPILHDRKRKKLSKTESTKDTVQIFSLDNFMIDLAPDIARHLTDQNSKDDNYIGRLLQAMKRPVATTVCRVNLIRATRSEVTAELRPRLSCYSHLKVEEDSHFEDVIRILVQTPTDKETAESLISKCTVPHTTSTTTDLFTKWPTRKELGWPMTNRVILCDRFCGESVLRGSDIFVRGVVAADYGIQAGEKVAVYTDIPSANSSKKKIARGLLIESYDGSCVFLGLGTAACSRSEMFNKTDGVAVIMSQVPTERMKLLLPPLSGIMTDKMMLQNLPSIAVAHALNPQEGDVILDMCSAQKKKLLILRAWCKIGPLSLHVTEAERKLLLQKICLTGLVLHVSFH